MTWLRFLHVVGLCPKARYGFKCYGEAREGTPSGVECK